MLFALLAFVGCGDVAVVSSLASVGQDASAKIDTVENVSSIMGAEDGLTDAGLPPSERTPVDTVNETHPLTDAGVVLDPQGVPCADHCAAWRADGMPVNTWAEYCGKTCGS